MSGYCPDCGNTQCLCTEIAVDEANRKAHSLHRPGSAYGVQRISKFLRVVSDPTNPSERGVMSNDNKLIAILGHYKPWKQWVMYPQPNTVWSTDCLAAINAHLVVLGSRPNAELCRRDEPPGTLDSK